MGRAARVADAAKSDALQVKDDVLSGQDALSSVAKTLSSKHRRADQCLHLFNGVGCACADTYRCPILAINILLGVAVFATASCGATGLGVFAIKIFPWALYTNVPITMGTVYWWNCGVRGVDDWSSAGCMPPFLGANNSALWVGISNECLARSVAHRE